MRGSQEKGTVLLVSIAASHPEASVLHEDLPAPVVGEDGEKLDAPVLLIAVAMDSIVKRGQDAVSKSSSLISLAWAGLFLLKKCK